MAFKCVQGTPGAEFLPDSSALCLTMIRKRMRGFLFVEKEYHRVFFYLSKTPHNSAIILYYKIQAGSAELLLLFDPWPRHFVRELRARFLLYGKAHKRGVVPRGGLKHTCSTCCLMETHEHRNVHWTLLAILRRACMGI